MVSIMLVVENERESQILKLAFEQRGITIISSKAQYQNYIKIMQYMPDIIMMEIPPIHMQQIHFAELLKNHKKTKRIPLVGYGDKMQQGEKNAIINVGINFYFERPLKFTQLIKVIETLLKHFNKTIENKTPVLDKEKDIELLLTSNTLPLKKIEIMTSYVSSLLAFPFTVTKVLSLAESEKSAAGDLARVIEADPVLSTQILKLSNSVLFTSLNRRISTIKDAIVRIGFRETKRLVMSMSVMQLFDEKNKNIGFDRMGFWCHSLASSIIAERLAKRMGGVNADEIFLAGLLHDFGVIVLDEFFPTIFSKILEDTTNTSGQFIDREKALLGIHHNDVIAELFTKWKLPDLVRESVVHQYDAESYTDSFDTPEKKSAAMVFMGNICAKTILLGKECDQYIQPIPHEFFVLAKMQSGFTKAFLDDVTHEMDIYREFLKLDISDKPASHEGDVLSEKTRIGIVNVSKDVFIPPFLYFQKLGCAVSTVPAESDKSQLDSAFDMFVLWADANTTGAQAKEFSHIIRFSEAPPSPDKPPAFAPVLAVLPVNCVCTGKEADLQQVSFLYNRFDLRQLDRYATAMLLGQVLPIAEAESLRAAAAAKANVQSVQETPPASANDTPKVAT